MNELIQTFADAVRDGQFIRLVLSRPVRTHESEIEKLTVRPIDLSGPESLQFTEHRAQKETHRNLQPDAAVNEVDALLGTSFRNAHLFTTQGDLAARLKSAGNLRIHRSPPSQQPANRSHDRTRKYLIPDGTPCPFLIGTGVMTAGGKVRAAKQDKFRQINRFLEFVQDVVPALPEEEPIRVIDFGCGKSYLTFALHYFLTEIHQRQVEITGLDLKADVVDDCNAIAERLDCRGLEFRTGDIADHSEKGPVHLTVSLHACDTASDHALARAVAWNARVIFCVPCCQHELASRLAPELLPPVQRHGILRERFAALATDALRAVVLEICGYRTQVMEFIDLEHTAKNLLIRAVRRDQTDPHREARIREYQQLKEQLGIESLALESALGDRLAEAPGLHNGG